ncbi:MAG: hypothetical protein NPIRA04_23740 [Nitrospirales bacterium]|nr:MAG: hypothetical protein NPIRA04_23740 [Nitrospirales bacterium]
MSALSITPVEPSQCNERWSMDFVDDSLLDGKRFRGMTVVDNYNRSLTSPSEIDDGLKLE